MNKLNRNVSKLLFSGIMLVILLLAGSCQNWMSNDDFMSKIENEVHDANAAPVSVYVRYANSKMGTSEPSGYTTMKVDVAHELNAVTSDDYGFVKWAAFSTKSFSPTKQHSALFYESAQDYNTKYKPLELGSNEVLFTDPKSPSTKVKIYSERNDIFIIPIVAKRPALVTSVPSNGRSDVVRNTQIRILFSKPIDEKTLVDEYGNSNIEITSGSAVLTESSEDLSAKDITDLFDITLGSTKKMLTLSLKPGENNTKVFLDGNSQISITIYEDVCDTDGYSLNGNTSFSFTTGTKFDSLAPYITILKAGAGQNCQDFEQYHYNKTAGTGEYNYTAAAENAPTDLNSYVNQPSGEVRILDQRIQNSVNIWVQAIDIQGSGSGVGKGADVTSENNVAQIQVRAKVISKANASDNGKTEAAAKTFLYAMGNKDTDCQINQSFETATGTNSGGQITKNSKGTLFTYGLDDLADGLIKIDLWAVDMVGNSGITEQNDYIAEYNNGYRSIFVVKDSTAPNATTNKTYVVPTGSASTSGYYNATTYAAIKIAGNTSITDQGNSYLSSPNSKLKWIVMPKEDTTWVKTISTDDPRWKYVTENYSGFPLPTSDGPVTLTYALMDDLGNKSDAVQLDAIKYDGTDPVINKLKFDPDTDYTEGIANGNILNNQTLVIPANEITSGIKSIELFVTKDSGTQAFDSPFDGAVITRKDGVNLNSYTFTNNKLTFATPVTNFNTDLLIKKLKIYGSTTEGKYTVKVKITDAADNYKETTIEQNTTVSLDSTKPLIQSVYIPDIKKAVQSNDPTAYAWIDYNSTNLTKTDTALFAKSIYITFKENNSGAKVFSFKNSSIKLTNESKLYKVTSTSATTGIEIEKKEIANNVLTLKDKITSEGAGSVIAMITNVQLEPDGSNLNLYITDRAKNVDENAFSDISSDNSIVTTSFKYDSSEPGIELTELKDNNTEVTQIPAQDGFTNNAYINASVTVTPTDSGVYALTITSDSPAVFDNTTEICAASNTTVKYKFDPLTGDNKTIYFNNGDANNSKPMYLAHANNDPIGLVIKNLKLTGTDGDKKIKIKATSFGGVPHTCEEKSIQLDTEPPEWNEKGIYGVYENDEKSDTIWPHPKTEQKIYGVTFDNNDNDIYFYKKTSMTVGFDIKQKEKNYLGTKWHPDSDATSFETHETLTHTVNANGVWVVYAYDKAGNKTSDKNIHFVLDDSFSPGGYAVIDNYMTIVAPDSSSKVFRNDTESSESHSTNYNYYNSHRGTTNYPLTSHQFIIKKTTNPYQIKVKLGKRTNGVKAITTADTWLDGTNPTSTTQLDSFGYTNVTQSASPIEYYSITHQYRTYPTYPAAPERFFEPEENYDFVWHKYEKNANGQKNQNNGDIYSYIDDDGDIVIELPTNISCPPLTLFLKDGCGNKIYRYIRPSGFSYDYNSVSWMVDDTIGNSSEYSGTLDQHNPDSIPPYPTGNINYYKSSGYINITNVNDRCRFKDAGDDITDGRYTLRSRIMAWGGTGEPAQDKFYKNDNNTLKENVVALSDWKGYKMSGTGTAFSLNNIEFPSVDANTPYELWYILEDTVGNCRKAKLTNGDASKWHYDDLPPLVDITGTTKVNRFNDNNYYSSSSSVTYQVEDVKSGVKNDGQKTYSYSERQTLVQGKTLSIGNKTPDSNGNLEFPEVEDFAGNKTTSILSNNAVLTWIRLDDAPSLKTPTEQYPTPVTTDTADIKDKNNKTVGETNSLLNQVTTTYNSTEKIITHTVNSQITNNKVSVTLSIKESSTDQPLLGWVVKNAPLTQAQFKDFYAVGDSDITTITNNKYEFSKTDSNKSWQETYANPTYFYPVNRAGLICTTAVCIKFENPATPALNGNITYSDVTGYVNGDTKINYFKGTSTLTIPTKNNANRCYIIYGSGTSDYIEYDLDTTTNSTTITLSDTVYSSMTGSNGTLKLKLFADYTGYYVESNEIGITGHAGKNCWVYDVTAPDFSLVSVKSKSSSTTDTTIYDSVKTGDVYYLVKKCPVIKFNYTHTDIKQFQYKASDAQSWTDITLDSNKTFSDTTNFTIPDNTTKTYNFRAIDRAGNISTQIDIQLNRDKTEPSGTLSGYSLNGTENADYIKEDDASTPPVTTIKYNPAEVNTVTLTLSDVSDSGAGIDTSDYLYYKTGGNETKLTSTSISLPDNLNNTEYEILIKDKFGNAKTIKKFKFTAYKNGPQLPSGYVATHLPYSGLASTPVYPGTYSASVETNWITGFKNGGDNYKLSSGTTEAIVEQSETPIWVYKNGKPESTKGSPKGYSITNFTSESPKFTLPVDYSSMPSKKLWYAITYMTFDVDENATIIPPESSSWTATWTEVADVSSGKIENVPIDTSKVEWNHTFIFVWYKDQFGHISVHALTNPKNSDTWNETWWTYDTTGGNGGGGNFNVSSSKGLSMLQGLVAGSSNASAGSGYSGAKYPLFNGMLNSEQKTTASTILDKVVPVEKPLQKAAPKKAKKNASKAKAAEVVQDITPEVESVIEKAVEQVVTANKEEAPVQTVVKEQSPAEPQVLAAPAVSAAVETDKPLTTREHSLTAIILAILALCAACAGIIVCCKKRGFLVK